MSTPPAHPRRRAAGESTHPTAPRLDAAACIDANRLQALQKGATFHTPASPSTEADPTIDVGRLPHRAPTSPKALEDLLASVDKKVDGLLRNFGALALSAKEANSPPAAASSDGDRALPNPAFILEHAASSLGDSTDGTSDVRDPFDLNDKADKIEAAAAASSNSSHSHESDSGIGSSVSGGSAPGSPTLKARDSSAKPSVRRTSVYSSVTGNAALNKTSASHFLDDRALAAIKKFVLAPLLAQEKLKAFHPIVKDIPGRIAKRQITCLRDVEKTLILSAPVSLDFSAPENSYAYHSFPVLQLRSKNPAAYLTFCETSIQCVHTTTSHLNDRDLRRPTDKAYTNNYFVDLVEQVRQYARIMEAFRIKRAEGKAAEKDDYKPYVSWLPDIEVVLTQLSGEKLIIKGGTSSGGKLEPLQLVREKDGEIISIKTEEIPLDDVEDSDVERSMARKRKCDIGKEEIRACRECGKEFKRPCDLTKHEKTHSRPWKCSDPECKYYTLGWPTEKERDRHVNDKHSSMPLLYRCLYKPCAYTSKRESNCKQHMEKAHGWEYVRSKSKKGQALIPTVGSPAQSAATPMSGFGSIATPLTNASYSPSMNGTNTLSPAESAATGSGFSDTSMYTHSLLGNYQSPYEDSTFDFNDFGNELHQNRRSESLETTGSGLTFGSDESFTTNGFDPNVNLGDITWPPVQPDDFFPTWDPTIQQPTPSYSDASKDMDMDATMLDFNMTSAGQQQQQTHSFAPHAGVLQTPEDDMQDFKPSGNDFPLFGEIGPSGGESSHMGAMTMFPELGTVGDQFGTDPMFSSMADGALDEYTNIPE
ncbi:hypothetical protein FH972_024193 [Carpinus fangiana]|uniref:C2H2-type domain-containing protein n=1 Tax=Carpinus fangiana TaxID=176857 RepID=A0A5N6KXB9_9ROSI|nr:hypothetical protein FH972_024193 [Carpinus fangiana]